VEVLIQREAARPLAALGDTILDLTVPRVAARKPKAANNPRGQTSVWVLNFCRTAARIRCRLGQREHLHTPGGRRGIDHGQSAKRTQTLAARCSLPWTETGTTEECLGFIETHTLYGWGIGWDDLQLLVATRLSEIHSGRSTPA
jgi:hypothetical protein